MGKPHAVVFPIPLQGHINPMMVLAKQLNSSGIRVTFLLTERTLSILHKNNSNNKHDMSATSHKDDPVHNTCGGEGGMPTIDNKNELNQPIAFGNSGHDNCNQQINNGNETGLECGAVGTRILQNDSIHYTTLQQEDEHECVNAHIVHNAPPIEFETIPDSASPHGESLPMSASVLLFLDSVPLLRGKLEEILEALQQKGHPATCIISDSFVPWTQDVADKFGIPRIEFWSSSVTVYSMGYHIPHLINGGYLPVQPDTERQFCVDIIPGLAPFRLVDFFYTNAISSPVFDVVSKAFSRAKEAHRVLVNSFYNLEKNIIDALRSEGVSIEPIGPLLPLEASRRHGIKMQRGEEHVKLMSTSFYADDKDCLAWLDTQAVNSVIYVSFGSMVSISKNEMQELILGLEGSQQPYLLVIRSDMMSEASTGIAGGRGRICSWAPQIHVLGHPAVAGFLTHCGWNSIMEAICMGVPMIGCPRESEQHTNMKCLRDEWKVAIGLEIHHSHCQREVCHCEESPTNTVKIKKELVERAVRDLMQEEIGAVLRRRIQGLQRTALRANLAQVPALQTLFANNPS